MVSSHADVLFHFQIHTRILPKFPGYKRDFHDIFVELPVKEWSQFDVHIAIEEDCCETEPHSSAAEVKYRLDPAVLQTADHDYDADDARS
ncbi:hypothetical protein PRECH8_05390 [Insulibacter thermoxylanivorax]|uniref:Uncharacterized protein n=1 Tax=Insulibacter thermoxylanivorax TaxID=2749268 RepID=A0A916QD93_9BACL|nr:hypothetical protein PRECH8_05390 [Insulibacter thermoxylanivorax]